MCTAPYYVAPEVLSDDYTNKCDVWSVGVLSYILLCGYLPFHGSGDRETLKLVQEGKPKFISPEWDTVSKEAKTFVQCLLQTDPKKRPSAQDALKYTWITQHYTPVEGLEHHKSPQTRIKLKFKSTKGTKNHNGIRKFLGSLRQKKQ